MHVNKKAFKNIMRITNHKETQKVTSYLEKYINNQTDGLSELKILQFIIKGLKDIFSDNLAGMEDDEELEEKVVKKFEKKELALNIHSDLKEIVGILLATN